jgi:peptidoglycan/xylan/chitin deacetylase (PgdA/CDA1 family)
MQPEDRQKNVDRIRRKFKEKVTNGMEMLTPDELSILANSDCVTVGSHTHGHELLNQLCSTTIQETVKMAAEQIARITGRHPVHFSYPNGSYDQRVLFQVQQLGYKTAVTTIKGRWTTENSLFEIPRIGIGRFDTRAQYKARISSFL